MAENSRVIAGEITRNLPVPLTEEERAEYARILAQEMETYNRKELEKSSEAKRLTKMLKDQRNLLDELALKVNTATEKREVPCTILHDYRANLVEIRRNDTDEIVEMRPMKPGEREKGLQLEL